MRKSTLAALGATALVAAALAGPAGATSAGSAGATSTSAGQTGTATGYLVLVKKGTSVSGVVADLKAIGAKVTSVNEAIGLVRVTSRDSAFRTHGKVAGVAGRRRRPDDRLGAGAQAAGDRAGAPQGRQGQGRRDHSHQGHPWRRPARRQPLGHADGQGRPGPPDHHRQQARCGSASWTPAVQADHPDIAPELRLQLCPATSSRTCPTSTGRASSRAASTRSARTTAVTARTSPAPSPRRCNGFGVSGVAPERGPRRGARGPGQRLLLPAGRRSTRSPTPATPASTW